MAGDTVSYVSTEVKSFPLTFRNGRTDGWTTIIIYIYDKYKNYFMKMKEVGMVVQKVHKQDDSIRK